MLSTSPPSRLLLRDLPVAARLTLAALLISVGIGYFSALVQLHFQHAQPGAWLPNGADAERMFSHTRASDRKLSKLEMLLDADENLPWNGGGQMSAAFTKKSSGWSKAIKSKAKQFVGRRGGAPGEAELAKAEKELRAQRNGEREAFLAWIRAGADKAEYEQDKFCLTPEVAKLPITPDFVGTDDKGPFLKVKTVLTERCVRCHAKDGEDAKATQFPLETYEQIKKYLTTDSGGAMSLSKLAQTTHVHLLGFAMLYGITGLILAFTSYPSWLRVPLAPLPLVAQVIDISLWWLARLDEPYGHLCARFIPITGMIVAGGLGLHILLSLWDLFGRAWKITLLVLIALAVAGGYGLKEKVIDPHLASEKASTTSAKE
jgi:hypothetical protein